MNNSNQMYEKQELLAKLRELDFALVETNLYLNSYPDSAQGLSYFQQLLEERKRLVAAFEQNYGPLTAGGNRNPNRWDWVNGPWPWEAEAN